MLQPGRNVRECWFARMLLVAPNGHQVREVSARFKSRSNSVIFTPVLITVFVFFKCNYWLEIYSAVFGSVFCVHMNRFDDLKIISFTIDEMFCYVCVCGRARCRVCVCLSAHSRSRLSLRDKITQAARVQQCAAFKCLIIMFGALLR